MKEHMKTMALTIKRTVPASPAQVYKEWIDPKSPCNPANGSLRMVYKPKLKALFYFVAKHDGMEITHYGQFLTLSPGKKIEQTWMGRYTRGIESKVTTTFKKQGKDTLVTVHHANLPDDKFGRMHDWGWNWYLDELRKQFVKKGK